MEPSLSEDIKTLFSLMFEKDREKDEKIFRLERMVEHLIHRPPHQVECECGRTLEIHCSEETKSLKDHFWRLEQKVKTSGIFPTSNNGV